MEVSDVDVVKAANSAFFLGEEVLRPRAERCRKTLGEDNKQEDPVQGLRDDVARGLDDGWSQGSRTRKRRWCARRRSEREHDHIPFHRILLQN